MADGNDKNILDPSSASQSGPTASVNNVIEVLYGSDDIQKAYPIPTNKIDTIQIKESFFSKLPTLKLVLSDVGTLFNTVGFQIGYTINIKITPIVKNKDVIPRNSRMCPYCKGFSMPCSTAIQHPQVSLERIDSLRD